MIQTAEERQKRSQQELTLCLYLDNAWPGERQMAALSKAQLLEKWQWAMGILQQEIPDDLPPEVCAQVRGSPAPPSHLQAHMIKGPLPTGAMMVDSPAGLMDFAVDVREAGSPTKVMEVALAIGTTSLLVDQEPSVTEQVGPPQTPMRNPMKHS